MKQSKKMNFSELVVLWKAHKMQLVKKSSYYTYVLLLENHILPHFKDDLVVNESTIQEFVFVKLNNGLSQKSTKDIVIVIKMILSFGAKFDQRFNPNFKIQFPSNGTCKHVSVLNRHEQRSIHKFLFENSSNKNIGLFICLNTGLRIGEICAITWEDLDLKKGVIQVNKSIQRIYIVEGEIRRTELIIDIPKTKNSIREVPLSNELIRLLKPLKKEVNPNHFLLSNSSRPIEPRSYRSYFKNVIKQANIPDIKFHALRHSFATRCIESNCDYKTVSVILGHSNISTTLNLYVHPNLEQKKHCIEKMLKQLN